MNNLEKEKKKLDTPDIIIISGIIISIVIAILGTIFWVRYKYNKEHKKELSTYTTIPNNKTYRYKLTDNKIDFYDGKGIVDTYTCISNCSIDKERKDQFIIEYDSFIPINDNNISTVLFIKRCSNFKPLLRHSNKGVSNKVISSAPLINISDNFLI